MKLQSSRSSSDKKHEVGRLRPIEWGSGSRNEEGWRWEEADGAEKKKAKMDKPIEDGHKVHKPYEQPATEKKDSHTELQVEEQSGEWHLRARAKWMRA